MRSRGKQHVGQQGETYNYVSESVHVGTKITTKGLGVALKEEGLQWIIEALIIPSTQVVA